MTALQGMQNPGAVLADVRGRFALAICRGASPISWLRKVEPSLPGAGDTERVPKRGQNNN